MSDGYGELTKEKNEKGLRHKSQLNLLSTNNTSLAGEIGEIIAMYYLRKIGLVPHHLTYEKIGQGVNIRLSYEEIAKSLSDENKRKYLADYKGRNWDFIAVKHRYKSSYGRRRIENAAYELRMALRDKDDEKIKVKEEEYNHLLKKFRIEEVYLIEVKTLREGAIWHDFTSKDKIGNIEEVKAHGFKVLLVIVTLLNNWEIECEHIEL
jgi:hypothetical protein